MENAIDEPQDPDSSLPIVRAAVPDAERRFEVEVREPLEADAKRQRNGARGRAQRARRFKKRGRNGASGEAPPETDGSGAGVTGCDISARSGAGGGAPA